MANVKVFNDSIPGGEATMTEDVRLATVHALHERVLMLREAHRFWSIGRPSERSKKEAERILGDLATAKVALSMFVVDENEERI